jgi:hypothetical protein
MKFQVITLLNSALGCMFAVARVSPAATRSNVAQSVAVAPMMDNADLLAMARSIRRA